MSRSQEIKPPQKGQKPTFDDQLPQDDVRHEPQQEPELQTPVEGDNRRETGER